MNANHVLELGRATLSGAMPFPDIAEKLIAEGVEYYHVDYVALQIRFYSAHGSMVTVALSFENLAVVAERLDVIALRATILDSQKNGQKFRDFSHRATLAGVAGYFAFLRGQRVTYLGRQGEHHVEWFPGADPADGSPN